MAQCTSSGYQTRWAYEGGSSPRTIDSDSVRIDWIKDSLRKTQAIEISEGITGTRSVQTSRRRRGAYAAGGTREANPSFGLLNLLLPHILGGVESSDTFPVAEEIPAWDEMRDQTGIVVRYNDIKVDKARLKFAPGKLLLSLDVLALTAIETGLTFPSGTSLPVSIDWTPLAFMDCTFNMASGTRNLTEGELLIDNGLTPHVFPGAAGVSCLREGERLVTLSTSNTSAAADYTALYGIDPTTITITMAYLNMSSVITLNNCLAPIETPVIDGKGEVVMGLAWQAAAAGDTKEIVWTNDPVNT